MRSLSISVSGVRSPRWAAALTAAFAVGVHVDPVDRVAGVMGELGEGRPLGAAVALSEGVQGVNVGQELRDSADELLAVQVAQTVRRRQPAEHIGCGCRQVRRQAEQRPFAIDTVRSSPAHPKTSPRM